MAMGTPPEKTMFGWIKKLASGWTNWANGDDRWYFPRGAETQSGVQVNEDIALTFVTVWACVSKLSKTMSTLPIHVFEKVSDDVSRRVDHPLNEILTYRANPDSTGLTLRETMMANLLLWGNAYAEIIRSDDRGEIRELVALPSRDITIKRTTDLGELYFEQQVVGGGKRQIRQQDMLYIPGMSLNGVAGLSVIGYQRESIGLGMAAAEMSGSFYKNGCWGGGFIQRDPDKVAGKLSPDAAQLMISDINKQIQGSKKSFGLALLREGMTYQGIDIPLKDAELLASRKFQRIEICGIFDVPPSKIHDLTDGKYNKVEQQDTGWAKDSLLPWAKRFETAIRAQLLPEGNLYVKHNLAGLMRGDLTSQMEAFSKGRQWGIYSINDVRQMLDLNPIANGDDYLEPLNMVVVGTPRQIALPAPEPVGGDGGDGGKSQTEPTVAVSVDYFEPLINDASRRIANKEIKAVENAIKRLELSEDHDKFTAWLDKFYTDHIPFMVACMEPIASAFELTYGSSWKSTPLSIAEGQSERGHAMVTGAAENPAKLAHIIDTWKLMLEAAIADSILSVVKQSTPESTLSIKELKS